MLTQFSRTELLLGKEAMDRLANARVAVFGIGGVGGYVCEALVRSGVSGTVKDYRIVVEEIRCQEADVNKGLVFRVTDPELLELTGGIVQGMSGSPILQNGKLIGAVTHVFVNDPTKGYGIFIEEMLARVS